jgi:mono/diheme cytochrome c family protein
MSPAARRILGSVVAILAVVLLVGVWIIRGPGPMAFGTGPNVALEDYKGANPSGVPAKLAQASIVERGAYLARAADCMVCHTAQGAKEYAGGLGFRLPFGTLYSTNITPDKETGIGNYSDQEFLNALHRGTRRDGARLYPAMPYTSYTYITDADALAIKAYLFSLAPVRAPPPANTLTFPFNQRWAMVFWSALFNPDTRFEPDTSKSPEWNRGAYLAEALAHCGECHTPRNLAFALNNRKKFGGALTRLQHLFGQGDRARRLERRRDLLLSLDRSRGRPRHRVGADGRGGGPQFQPAGAGRHPRHGGLSAHRAGKCVCRSAGGNGASGAGFA